MLKSVYCVVSLILWLWLSRNAYKRILVLFLIFFFFFWGGGGGGIKCTSDF